jgi:outer membrane protein assembly factor BamB
MNKNIVILIICFTLSASNSVFSVDWPTMRHDNYRSGVTTEQLTVPLQQSWLFNPLLPPAPAWSGPAKWDAYISKAGLQSMRNFDPVYFVTVAGKLLYWGSSVDNAVHCFSAKTGQEKWVYITAGPVRVAPTIWNNMAYFGSDDGYVYCVNAQNGKLIWKHRAPGKERLISHNGRMISQYPCRTGVLIQNGKAYYAFSLFPWNSSWFCAADAKSGKINGNGLYEKIEKNSTFQSALLATDKDIFAPQGRTAPLIRKIKTGKAQAQLKDAGGTFCVLTPEGELVTGPKNQKNPEDVLKLANSKNGSNILTFKGTTRIVIDGEFAYLHQRRHLNCLNRVAFSKLQQKIEDHKKQQAKCKKAIKELKKQLKSDKNAAKKIKANNRKIKQLESKIKELNKRIPKCHKWQQALPVVCGLIKAGSYLIAGLADQVIIIDSKTGKKLWSAPVDGKAYGLTVANGSLFVSTDNGKIYCFKAMKK